MARIVNYNSRIVIYSYKVLATVIIIVNYDCTVITIVNYDRKTFIIQATGMQWTNDPAYSLSSKKVLKNWSKDALYSNLFFQLLY
jgi:hypothetical protein